MPVKNLICIQCPVGCHLEVVVDGKTVTSIQGNLCPRGESYGEQEVSDPRRIVTTTAAVSGGQKKLVPVKTNGTVPKGITYDVVKKAAAIAIPAPVKMGDILIKGVCGTDVDLVATRSVEAG